MLASAFLFAAAATTASAQVQHCSQYDPTHKLETPCNVVLKNSTNGYVIRAYNVGPGQQSFSTARVTANSWAEATGPGFQKNFVRPPPPPPNLTRWLARLSPPPLALSPRCQAYIEGANSQSVKIPMTAPVLNRIVGGSGDQWLVSFFTPQSIYPDTSTTPLPTASDMFIDPLPLSTFAVLEFPGEANGISYEAQRAKLVSKLMADNVTMVPDSDPWAFAYAGYDAPDDLFNR